MFSSSALGWNGSGVCIDLFLRILIEALVGFPCMGVSFGCGKGSVTLVIVSIFIKFSSFLSVLLVRGALGTALNAVGLPHSPWMEVGRSDRWPEAREDRLV